MERKPTSNTMVFKCPASVVNVPPVCKCATIGTRMNESWVQKHVPLNCLVQLFHHYYFTFEMHKKLYILLLIRANSVARLCIFK